MEHANSTSDPKAFYRRYNACCNAHDFAGLGEFVAPDVRVNGEVWGLARYQQGLEAVITAFPDYRWHLDGLLADGDWLAARFTDQGTHLGPFLGVGPTGRIVTTLEFAFYRLERGKITEVWVTADNLGTLRQLGALPDQG